MTSSVSVSGASEVDLCRYQAVAPTAPTTTSRRLSAELTQFADFPGLRVVAGSGGGVAFRMTGGDACLLGLGGEGGSTLVGASERALGRGLSFFPGAGETWPEAFGFASGILGAGADAVLKFSGGAGVGLGLGLINPGGAASSTGAPHISQNSPSGGSGFLQKRHSNAVGAAGEGSLGLAFAGVAVGESTAPQWVQNRNPSERFEWQLGHDAIATGSVLPAGEHTIRPIITANS